MLQESSAYSGWKKSCTTLDGWNPINNGINHLSTGAGFLPSTVSHLLQDLVTFSFATNQPHTRAPMSNMLPDFLITGPEFAWKGYGGDGWRWEATLFTGNHMEITWKSHGTVPWNLWGIDVFFLLFYILCVFKRWEKQKIVVSEIGHEMAHPCWCFSQSKSQVDAFEKKCDRNHRILGFEQFCSLHELWFLRFLEGPEAR